MTLAFEPHDAESRMAIIGIGCRFPGGANDPSTFWALLRDGADAITEVPPDRWNLDAFYDSNPAAPGKMSARYGGFIGDIDRFDTQFFGMSPREAARADPQQRLLLEVAFEALEDAGQTTDRLGSLVVGVFIGISSYDYGGLQTGPTERPLIDAYTNLGGALSIAANRISYAFNLTGPSIAIDTACSSSLVAVHLACRSIVAGDCALALAGGVNVILRPETTIGFSKAAMLAPDGRCKSFDARANGYVRAEGAGVVVLKPFTHALRDGDPIYAVIRGTAVNQDGRTNGISVPSLAAQERILREACRRARVLPQQIQYFEAHGTGTPVGDPIEATAIGNVAGKGRPDGQYCVIGSVKTNIGHLEAASGIAGLIKAALALKQGQIPGNLYLEHPNPRIPFDALRLRVARQLEAWPETASGSRLAAVNSFGFGGTNAHAILEAAPLSPARDPTTDAAKAPATVLLPLSTRSLEALRARVRCFLDFLDSEATLEDVSLTDICYSAAIRRWHHEHRLAVVARSKPHLADQLRGMLVDRGVFEAARSTPVGRSPKVAFIFSGMGPQWWAMGRELRAEEAIFLDTLERCDTLLHRYTRWSLMDELNADEQSSRMQETNIAQPAIFALQVALVELWKSWGIAPDAILGHSVGEVAAAYAAGALELEAAIHLIFHRSRLQHRTAGQGKMLAVSLPHERIKHLLAGHRELVAVAAINSPSAVTLSGDTEILQRIAAHLAAEQTFYRFLQVDVPYHSPKMDPLRAELLESLRDLRPRETRVDLYSSITGGPIAGSQLDAAYWWSNMRSPVLFAGAMRCIIDSGFDVFLQIGPHPVLHSSIAECLAAAEREAVCLPSLKRELPERATMLGSLGKLYSLGAAVNWSRVNHGQGRVVSLPSYPWQRSRHWCESEQSLQGRLGCPSHPLLGTRTKAAYPSWTTDLRDGRLGYLLDHRYQNTSLFPAAAYVEMAIAAAGEVWGRISCAVEAVEFKKALWLREDRQNLQLVFDSSQSSFEIFSGPEGAESSWVRHACGHLRRIQDTAVPACESLESLLNRCSNEIPREECYRRFEQVGLRYGARFQTIQRLWHGRGETLARIRLDDAGEECAKHHYQPALLDGCFQALLGAVYSESDGFSATYLPVQIDSVRIYAAAGLDVWSYARVVEDSASALCGDIRILDLAGCPIAEIRGFRCQRVGRVQPDSAQSDRLLYQYEWRVERLPAQGQTRQTARDLPSPLELIDELGTDATSIARSLARQVHYKEVRRRLDSLSARYVVHAFERLGWRLVRNQRFSTDSLARHLGILSSYHGLLARYLDMLRQDEMLNWDGSGWTVCLASRSRNPQQEWRKLLFEYPAYQAELTLLERCGRRLPDVLRGEVDPLELVFPKGTMTTAEHLYQDSPTLRIYNALAQKAVAAALSRLPEGSPVRILEIGAGTGGTTTYILPVLPASRTEYVFTDVSRQFHAFVEHKFRRYPFVTFQTLDIQEDPERQGFEPGSFDLIVASDVLHATRQLRVTLANVKKLLAPGGLLVLVEFTNPPRWLELVFGLLRGWWNFADADLRPSHCLLPFRDWREILAEAGFHGVAGISDTDGKEEAEHTLILARAATEGVEARPVSQMSPRTQQVQCPRSWLVFADDSGTGRRIADRLRTDSEQVVIVEHGSSYERLGTDTIRINPDDARQFASVVEQMCSHHLPLRGVIYLWGLDASDPSSTTALSLLEDQQLVSVAVLHLVRALVERIPDPFSGLWLVTRAAQPVKHLESVSVAQAPLWGLGRVILNELPHLRVRLLDIGPDAAAEEIEALLEELASGSREDEVALRRGLRYVHRLTRASLADLGDRQEQRERQAPPPFRLEVVTPGILDSLTFRTMTRQRPEPGKVEIEVHAAALNFKDVAKAMSLLGDTTLAGTASERALGLECAGKVAAIGEGVTGLQAGDDVVAFAPYSLASHATTDARFVLQKPAHLTFEEATTTTLVFVTAHYALNHLARLGRGERILIHAGAGGVGLAAIQLARRAGAEIFATAGSPEKREFLKALGVRHVMDSRSLSFVDEIMDTTSGAGVDVILNSLPGDAIPSGLSLLATGGRFVELGKRDIDQNSKLALRLFQNNIFFFAVDLDRLCLVRPDSTRALFLEVARLLANKRIWPLPHRVFPPTEIAVAFRNMAQARHIGKVVVSLRSPVAITASCADGEIFRPNATYLITGGLGGLGRVVAEWMVGRGARHLVLVGRSGAPSPAAKLAVERMRKRGAEVRVAKADVSDAQQVAAVLREVNELMPPLRGIVHAAMVLDDGFAVQLTPQQLRSVMLPKMIGAWNLHSKTLDTPLDFFVMFSSFSSLIGNPGQGNYAAANAFLDALAHQRRRNRLPALAVNWGPVLDAGYVAENAGIAQHFARLGANALPSGVVLEVLGQLLQQSPPQVGVLSADWLRWAGAHAAGSSPRFSGLARDSASVDTSGSIADQRVESVRDVIQSAAPSDRQRLAEGYVGEQVAKVMGISQSALESETPLTQLGLDSLMAMEMSNRLQLDLRVTVPPVKFLDGLTVTRLAAYVVEQFAEPARSSRPPAPPATPEERVVEPASADDGPDAAVRARLEELSDAEVDELLEHATGKPI